MKEINTESPIYKFFLRLVTWREKHVKEKNFVLFLALIVGICCGFAAMILKFLIHLISSWLTGGIKLEEGNYIFIVFPAIGVILSAL